jgi:hypothetical protein
VVQSVLPRFVRSLLLALVFSDLCASHLVFITDMLGILELSLQVLNSFNPAKYGALVYLKIE